MEAGSSTWEAGKAVQGGGSHASIPKSPGVIGLLVPKKNLPKEVPKRKRKMKVFKVWWFGVLRKEALSLDRTRLSASASSGTVTDMMIIYDSYI